MTTITLTDAQITQAFEDWENDFRANPSAFMSPAEVAAMQAATCAERSMIAFKAYVRQRGNGSSADAYTDAPQTDRYEQLLRSLKDRQFVTVADVLSAWGLAIHPLDEAQVRDGLLLSGCKKVMVPGNGVRVWGFTNPYFGADTSTGAPL